jgi:hypothetical protein
MKKPEKVLMPGEDCEMPDYHVPVNTIPMIRNNSKMRYSQFRSTAFGISSFDQFSKTTGLS